MKLELKHLIDSYKYQDDIIGASDTWRIVKISDTIITLFNGKQYNDVFFKHFKLDYSILKRPLSDLTKEIKINGEKFIPIEWFRNDIKNVIFEMGLFTSLSIKGKNECFINCGTYIFINNKLLEWHFDIYGLIENGLAIDINTL